MSDPASPPPPPSQPAPSAPSDAASAAPSPQKSMGARIVSATVAIAAANILARLLGLIQWRIIGHYYAMSAENDAYVAVFNGLLGSVFLLGEESLAPAYLPVFAATKEKDGEESAWRFTSTILNLYFLALVGIVAILMFCPEQAIDYLTRLGSGEDAGDKTIDSRSTLAVRYLTYMAPGLFGLSLGSMTYVVLIGYKRFFWAAFAEAALKGAFVIALVLAQMSKIGPDALIVAVLASGAAKITVHFLGLGKTLRFYRPTLALTDPRVRQFFFLVAPLLAGALFAKVRDYFNYTYVLSKDQGLLSINDFGRKIYSALGWLVPYPLSIAMLPFFLEASARNDQASLGKFLTQATRMLLMVFVPLAAVIGVLSVPLAQLFYETGKMTAEKAEWVGKANACYCAVLPFYALEVVYMQAYFSQSKTYLVTVIGVLTSALSMLGCYIGVFQFGVSGVPAVMLVATTFTATKALKVVILATMLKRSGMPFLPMASTLGFLLRACVLAAACAGTAYGTLHLIKGEEAEPPAVPAPSVTPTLSAEKSAEAKDGQPAAEAPSGMRSLLRAAKKLALPGVATLIVFLLVAKLLQIKELDEMFAFAKEKLKRRGKKQAQAPPPDAGA